MKSKLLFTSLFICVLALGQDNTKISTLDFVQVLNNNNAEAVYYFRNNWMKLREMALQKAYIESFEFLETTASENEPFNYVLITTYPNKEKYEAREEHFAELIKERGA